MRLLFVVAVLASGALVGSASSVSRIPKLGDMGEYWGGMISCASANPCNVTTNQMYGATQFFIPYDTPAEIHVDGQFLVMVGSNLGTYFGNPASDCCPSTSDGGCYSPFGYLKYKGGCSGYGYIWLQVNNNFTAVTIGITVNGSTGPE